MSRSANRSDRPDPVANIYQAVLDRLRLGIALFDRHGRIFMLNRAAERLVADLDSLNADARSYAGAGLPAGAEALGLLIADVLAADDTRQRERVRLIPRNRGRAPLSILAARLPPAGAGLSSTAGSGVAGVVFISAPEAMIIEAVEGLDDLFGISATEAKIAAALASGKQIAEIAFERGVSVNTIRTQLKRLLAKTGTRRQAELLRLILTNVVALCELGQAGETGASD